MNGRHLIAVIIGTWMMLFMVLGHGGTPLWVFTPLTATQITVPMNEIATVKYEVKNQSKRSHMLVMTTIPGVSQITTPGNCPNPFVLGSQQSCILNLTINEEGLRGNVLGGPVVCQQGNPNQCYQPSRENSLKIIKGTYDVAIIGAGVSGSYTAFRIKDTYPNQSIAVLEMSDRVGGRLFSYLFPNTNTFAELGGMRIGKLQTLAYHLVKNKLKLTLQDTNFKLQLTYFDGNQCNSNMPPDTVCNQSFVTLSNKIKNMFPCNAPLVDTTNVEAIMSCLEKQKYLGAPLNSYSALDFYKLAITPNELVVLYQFSNAYRVFLSNEVSAIQHLTTLYTITGTFYSIESGMQSIPIQLINMFKNMGGKLFLNTQVNDINWDEEKKLFTITSYNAETHSVQLMKAKKIIWAAGKSAIFNEKINFFDEDDKQLLNSVQKAPAVKVWFTYSDFWWSALGIYRGYSITDLPLASIYYFDPLPPQTTSNTNALIKASYSYGNSALYWQNYMNNYSIIYWDGTTGYLGDNFNNLLPNPNISSLIQTTYAPMVDDVTKQLILVHGISIPAPQAYLMINWEKPPFDGFISKWGIVPSIPKTSHQITNINPNIPFYIVGDTWAANTGWVEGALQTSEYVLNNYFNINPPSWLKP